MHGLGRKTKLSSLRIFETPRGSRYVRLRHQALKFENSHCGLGSGASFDNGRDSSANLSSPRRRPPSTTARRHLSHHQTDVSEYPQRWRTVSKQSPCVRANSSETPSSAASRWSCKLPPTIRPLARPQHQQYHQKYCRTTSQLMWIPKEDLDGTLALEEWILTTGRHSDILHPNRANISKDELRGKLAEMYKANKDQVNVFGLQTQFGGGKTTGFALVYDSPEALKKFEPHYRLVRVGFASKIEKPSRQQRMSLLLRIPRNSDCRVHATHGGWDTDWAANRQATQEQTKDSPGYGEGQGCQQEEGQIDESFLCWVNWRCGQIGVAEMGRLLFFALALHFQHMHGFRRHWGYGC